MQKVVQKSHSQELWVMRHSPTCQADLAVHKKKVEEVLAWVQNRLHNGAKAHILLMVGPTGSGKTITLQVVAQQSNFEVAEWINPLSDTNTEVWKSNISRDEMRLRDMYPESQKSKFAEFLLRSNRYPALDLFGHNTGNTRKILLVEDFPNSIIQEPKQFHDLLKTYQRKGNCPLVFILSDNERSSSNERLLFPSDVQSDLQIDIIRFNPIAPTSMTKVLTHIAALESKRSSSAVRVPSAEVIDQLIVSSGGDIRSAINALQFFCLNSPKLLSAKAKSASGSARISKKRSHTLATKSNLTPVTSEETSIGLRDTNLSLFRALGKILYCKRENGVNSDNCVELPDHLSNHHRDPLAMAPEDIVDKSQISPDGFTAFLHQNYLDFYMNIDDIASASEYLSDADHLTREWVSRSVLEEYSSSVATRGILFCNVSRAAGSSSATGLGWKPLHKPEWFSALKKSREYKDLVQNLFREQRLSTTELVTQFLPYVGALNTPQFSQAQAAVAREVGKFSKLMFRNLPEKFDEKDFALQEEKEDDDEVSSRLSSDVQTNENSNGLKDTSIFQNSADDLSVPVPATQNSDEDSFTIEEYDD